MFMSGLLSFCVLVQSVQFVSLPFFSSGRSSPMNMVLIPPAHIMVTLIYSLRELMSITMKQQVRHSVIHYHSLLHHSFGCLSSQSDNSSFTKSFKIGKASHPRQWFLSHTEFILVHADINCPKLNRVQGCRNSNGRLIMFIYIEDS